jgi:hypothetical protein
LYTRFLFSSSLLCSKVFAHTLSISILIPQSGDAPFTGLHPLYVGAWLAAQAAF